MSADKCTVWELETRWTLDQALTQYENLVVTRWNDNELRKAAERESKQKAREEAKNNKPRR